MDDWDIDNTDSPNMQGRGEIFKNVEKQPASDAWTGSSDASGWGDTSNNNNDSSGWGGSSASTGRGGGGGGGGRGGKCYNCDGEGHMSRDCPQPRAERGGRGGGRGGGGSRACFNCQKEGHNSRDCPEPRAERGRGGRGGGRGGGFSGSSSQGDWGGSDNTNGTSNGWNAGETTASSDAWGSSSNASDAWGSGGDRGSSGGRGGGGSRACFNCQKEGHNSRDCPEPRTGGGGGSRACFNCQKEGHNSRDCPEPRAERGRGGRGGGRGGGGFGRSSSQGDWGGSDNTNGTSNGWNASESTGASDWGSGGGRGDGGQDGESDGRKGGSGCRRCGKEGHMAKECTEPGESGRPPVTYIPEEVEETEDSIFHRGTEAGINFSKYDHVPVKVTGENVPRAITSFDKAGLRDIVASNVRKAGYTVPTPVQKHAIPIVMGKRDLMACAQTGSGKTAAYLIPIINHLLEENCAASSFEEKQSPEAVIMCPTRELAIQIEKEGQKFAYGSVIKTVVVYGGVQPRFQAEKVKRGCNILVATPGRLLDFLQKGVFDFSKCKFLVLDEADRMLDMGFKEEVKRAVYSPTMPIKGERNTLMFSATFPNEVQQLASEFLQDYLFLAVGMVGGACSDVVQEVIPVDSSERVDRLKQILRENEGFKTLIFTSAKKSADFLAAILCSDDFSATSIHGDRLQAQREEAVRDFTTGRRNILVATAVAARGLDIKGVGLVINYEMPNDIDEYVHRIGRTGRVGNTGRAISFFNESKDAELAGKLVTVLSNAQQEIPDFLKSASSGSSFGSGGPASRFGGSDMRNFGRNVQAKVETEDAWD